MTKTAVFSISSKDYLEQASVGLESFKQHCDYQVEVHNLSIEDILSNQNKTIYIQSICDKYYNDQDKLRWCLKPSMLLYFLFDLKYDKCIYIDNDIYFVNNNTFLIDSINKGILLTKHNRPIWPHPNMALFNQFLCNFTDGFFNAGFIGANKNSSKPLAWWHMMNLWRCEKNKNLGLFDDQKYLDTLALNFNSVIDICDHQGCNLALWNTSTIKRYFEDKWIVGDNIDPIFCHFSGITPENCLAYKDYDFMLFSYYRQYLIKINNVKSKQNSLHNILY